MRLSSPFLVFLFLAFLGLVSARSAVGDRILVVLEDGGEKNLYSQFWADLECTLRFRTLEEPPLLTKWFVQHETSN